MAQPAVLVRLLPNGPGRSGVERPRPRLSLHQGGDRAVITRLTKIQLLIFAVVTLIGGTIVGGRYAQIDRLVVDRTYEVRAQLSASGGIFQGAEVTYRGIKIGRVDEVDFTDDGVDIVLAIENDAPDIPRDATAVVANKSAIGEQYVDLRPQSDSEPYLQAGDVISRQDTEVPIETTTLLINTNELVSSIDTGSLNTVVSELGQAFEGTGRDLETILDTSTSFIEEAHANIDVTRELIRKSGTVLQTQVDKRSEIATFAQNLALFSDTLREADPDLRAVVDNGAPTAQTLDEVVDENAEDLTALLDNLAVAGEPLLEGKIGLQSILILYPYLLQGTFSVVSPSDEEGEYDANFGLVLTPTPHTCSYYEDGPSSGYRDRRNPADVERREFDTTIDCRLPDNDIARQAAKTEYAPRTEVPAATEEGKAWGWMLLDVAAQ
ncbi:MCE family protein [Aeromicrobium camelliae]|uniref:MCE family protein n=1 Tax=Aeromicrobium camelliae TaxID=1538144 RepID=A0A3N6ZIJ4_9ACTN|nr:MCE family protein [Aeromicrobium camelliae]